MNITEARISEIIREVIDEATFGNVDHFTPYSQSERERNFHGIGRMGNPSYDAFKAWREDGLRRGFNEKELGWEQYMKMKNM